MGGTEIAFDRNRLVQTRSGQRIRAQQVLQRTFVDDLAALTPRMRTHLHGMASHFNDIRVMFYHQNSISSITHC